MTREDAEKQLLRQLFEVVRLLSFASGHPLFDGESFVFIFHAGDDEVRRLAAKVLREGTPVYDWERRLLAWRVERIGDGYQPGAGEVSPRGRRSGRKLGEDFAAEVLLQFRDGATLEVAADAVSPSDVEPLDRRAIQRRISRYRQQQVSDGEVYVARLRAAVEAAFGDAENSTTDSGDPTDQTP